MFVLSFRAKMSELCKRRQFSEWLHETVHLRKHLILHRVYVGFLPIIPFLIFEWVRTIDASRVFDMRIGEFKRKDSAQPRKQGIETTFNRGLLKLETTSSHGIYRPTASNEWVDLNTYIDTRLARCWSRDRFNIQLYRRFSQSLKTLVTFIKRSARVWSNAE